MRRILGFSLFLGLMSGCPLLVLITGREKAVTYYAPVVSPGEKQVAYLKRTVRFKRIGRAPFWGHAPMSFKLDKLELCTARLDLSGESCLEEWNLPIEKANPLAKGEIEAELAWRGSGVSYRIKLNDFLRQCGDQPCPPIQVLSNVKRGQKLKAATQGPWHATVDDEAWRHASPEPNKIIIRRRGDD